jgi:hypothetical protein
MIDDFVAQWGQPDTPTDPSVFFVRGDPGYRQWKRLSKKATPGVWAKGFLVSGHLAQPDGLVGGLERSGG